MSTKHTPGPWELQEKKPGYYRCNPHIKVFDDNGRTVCDVDIAEDQEKLAMANARLIAAAPDLLDALTDLALLAAAAMRESGGWQIDEELKDARAAIAKAIWAQI